VRSFGVVTHTNGPTRITEAQRAAARESMKSGAAMTGAYLGMNAAASLIAGFGLLANSPAEHAFVRVPARAIVAQHIREFPSRQKPRLFSVDHAMEMLINTGVTVSQKDRS
jgi:hypothetical protein